MSSPSPPASAQADADPDPPLADRPVVVGIGGSAGSVTALQHFFDAVPEDPGLAFVVVTHLNPEKASLMAEVLQAKTSLPVTQVAEPTQIEKNHIYVIAPGQTLDLEGTALVPREIEGKEERHFPIDHFFRSLAEAPVEPIGVVFSGAGTDGSVGLSAIKEVGGLTAAQDPSEAEYDSMPRAAIGASRVDLVLPVSELARRLSNQPRLLDHLPLWDEPEKALEEEGLEEVLRNIFEEVQSRTGYDFHQYKRSTMLRRIGRRLQVHEISSLSEYLAYLKEHPGEATALFRDCLISVTSFFRNPEAFAALREEAIPEILSGRGPSDQVRAWSVGCATGEEAYSLAMLLLEQAASKNVAPDQIQVFATDLDEEALARARNGRYPEAIASDVPKRYLKRFFRKEESEYVVRQEVRERVLFTTHNVLSHPPFSKLDLISCRNLLIYLQRELQEKVFTLFSYALNEEGFLFLGRSESAGLAEEYFRAQNTSHGLYQRRKGPAPMPELPSGPLAPSSPRTADMTLRKGTGNEGGLEEKPTEEDGASGFAKRRSSKGHPPEFSQKAGLHLRLLEAYAPPSAVVDKPHRIVHLSQRAGRFLQQPGGTPSDNVVELVRPELKMKLRPALREAFAEGKETRTQPVRVQFDGETRPVRLIVRPVREGVGTGDERLALVLFDELEEKEAEEGPPAKASGGGSADRAEGDTAAEESGRPADSRVAQLEAELEQTEEELRATIAEHQISKHEMQATIEELRSMNEEYQSSAEELETSKEELQSVNEELESVNQQLEEKVQQLKEANADLENLMAATNIGTLFLGEELSIQRFTPRIKGLFNIREADEGRPIGDLTHHLGYDDLVADAQRTLQEGVSVEKEARSEAGSEEGNWFLVRHHPYRTAEGEVDGVVVTFVDITRRKKAEQEIRNANESLQRRTEQVQNLTEALTSAEEEEERRRLSEVLHDTVQQTLFAAQLKINTLKSDLTDEKCAQAESAKELIEEGIETARNLSRELDPPVGGKSLGDAFEWLAEQMEEVYGLSVLVEAGSSAESKDQTADKSLKSLIFRLTRELLFNVAKHAEVEEAFLHLEEGKDQLQVVVEDEGKGFDPEGLLSEDGLEDGGGQGLVSIRDRIEMIGGTFELESAPGEGTRVTMEVPWQTDGTEKQL